jgi:hypothetical protein
MLSYRTRRLGAPTRGVLEQRRGENRLVGGVNVTMAGYMRACLRTGIGGLWILYLIIFFFSDRRPGLPTFPLSKDDFFLLISSSTTLHHLY